jgi:hypothetical protein
MAENEETQEERELNVLGEAFIAGRSRANAQRALDAADAVEISQVRVRAVRDGYFAPPEVVDKYAEMLQAEEEEAAAAKADADAEAAAKAEADAEAARNPDETANAETPAEPEVPTSKWSVKQIDDWAANQTPPIVFDEGAVKADKLRAIETAVNQKKE